MSSPNNAQQELSANTQSPSFSFSKKQRLLNAKDFSPVFDDAPIRASHQHFLILARPRETADTLQSKTPARLGLVIAKKHVRRAHERNRIKRYARETFRLQQHKLPVIDAIVLARKGADTLTDKQLQQTFNGLWKRIIKRAAQLAP